MNNEPIEQNVYLTDKMSDESVLTVICTGKPTIPLFGTGGAGITWWDSCEGGAAGGGGAMTCPPGVVDPAITGDS